MQLGYCSHMSSVFAKLCQTKANIKVELKNWHCSKRYGDVEMDDNVFGIPYVSKHLEQSP